MDNSEVWGRLGHALYLDDYLTLGKKESDECACNLAIITDCCKELGVPLKQEKVEDLLPHTYLVLYVTFLGVDYSIVPNVSIYLPNTFRVMIILIPVYVTTKMDAEEVAFF